MPGIFGCIGSPANICVKFQNDFAGPYGGCESFEIGDGILGGHAFAPARAVHVGSNGLRFAVDGEASIYRSASEVCVGNQTKLFEISSKKFCITSACKGNIAVVDPETATWNVAADWTGGFPLFYTRAVGGLVFCSRLKPLARVVGSSPDEIAIREFFHDNYMLSGRSFFKGIQRLMPGQMLSYNPAHDSMTVTDGDTYWIGRHNGELFDRGRAAEIAWTVLTNAVSHALEKKRQTALMMSAGWDSRTLLAVMRTSLDANDFITYSHGDLRSRELSLAARISCASGVRFHAEAIDDAVFDLTHLQWCFERAETVVFPEWHRAGRLFRELGITCVSAGVYGEALGGHYGPIMLQTGGRKVLALAGELFRSPRKTDRVLSNGVEDLLRVRNLVKLWYIKESFWSATCDLEDAINNDIEITLQRMRARGAEDDHQLIEAFILEHRAAQYINSQLLSCRASIDISIPFADRELLTIASHIPFAVKVHNALNKEMLQNHAPDLLRFSTAATLVPTWMPILIQEGSRLARHFAENVRWNLHRATNGRIDSPRFDCFSWEFLYDGRALTRLVDDFRCDFWQQDLIRQRISQLRNHTPRDKATQASYLARTLLKMYTIDLMLR